jgi:tripartite ATP-independent transporter DctM subunit
MVALPMVAAGMRAAGSGFAESDTIVRHLNLVLAFLGAAIAARDDKLLRLATGEFLPAGTAKRIIGFLVGAFSAVVTGMLARASWDFMVIEREFETEMLKGVPMWPILLTLPLCFGGVGLRLAYAAGTSFVTRGVAALAFGAGVWVGGLSEWFEEASLWPGLIALIVATLLGAPLFVALGGAAIYLFMIDGVPAGAVPVEMVGLVSSPFLAAIPLFTLAGYVLSRGGAPSRLVAVFRATLGWLPGGTAAVAALACTFFTAFTGGSGVTILALGGLMMTALKEESYPERFSLGLLTGSGSLGLLFAPALPLILFGIAAEVPIEDLFLGGLLPGMLLVLLTLIYCIRQGRRSRVPTARFDPAELGRAVWRAKFELSIPVIVLVAIFGGFATIVEAAALTAAYALVVQVVVHRDIRIGRDLLRVFAECIAVLGGILIILCVAKGLTSYMVDAEVPANLLEWVQSNVDSRILFLLGLNVFLLIVGCFMDVYSATFVVVPLILPLGEAYGIHPVHLGILFVANLELGYLTPPVGLNLFVASYRFDRPLLDVTRASLPMFAILGVGVLVITYVSALSLALLP